MFEITTCPVADVEQHLRSALEPHQFRTIEPILDGELQSLPSKPPFVQLGYEDIDTAFLDLALGYADIVRTNGPVGLDGSFSPIHQKFEVVVFPLAGLERHLEETLQPLISALRAEGEPNRFLSAAHQYRSSQELLVSGLLACNLFARQHHQALRVRW